MSGSPIPAPDGAVFRLKGCELNEEETIALILRVREDYSLRDIASLTTVSYGTVKRRLDSAQATYRRALEHPEYEVYCALFAPRPR